MSKVRIVADSTCDLTKELLEKYDISIIPLCIVMDEKSYYDGLQVTPDEIFKWADANKTTPKTAAATMDKTEEVLAPFMDAGDDIIFIGISSGVSGFMMTPRAPVLSTSVNADRATSSIPYCPWNTVDTDKAVPAVLSTHLQM